LRASSPSSLISTSIGDEKKNAAIYQGVSPLEKCKGCVYEKRPVMIEGKLRMWRVYVDIQAAQAGTHVSHRIIVTQYRALWIPPLLECDPKSLTAFLTSLEYPTVLYRGTLYLLLAHHFPTRFIEPSVDWGLSLIRSS